jgi:hypothetical protein
LFNSIKLLIFKILSKSNRVHLRTNSIGSTKELVDLIDRFIDGNVRHDFEWDDFISWQNEITQVELIRNQIGMLEPLLVSNEPESRAKYTHELVVIRNRIAALLGMKTRDLPEWAKV